MATPEHRVSGGGRSERVSVSGAGVGQLGARTSDWWLLSCQGIRVIALGWAFVGLGAGWGGGGQAAKAREDRSS